jgi:hypothetical protein
MRHELKVVGITIAACGLFMVLVCSVILNDGNWLTRFRTYHRELFGKPKIGYVDPMIGKPIE